MEDSVQNIKTIEEFCPVLSFSIEWWNRDEDQKYV